MDPCFDDDFTATSAASFGNIKVTLAKRKTKSTHPCAELLCVGVDGSTTQQDIAAYNKFHVGYVMHRVRQAWPHQFALVYDTRGFGALKGVSALIEETFAFIMMHSELGQHYQTWLHKIGVFVSSDTTVSTLNRIIGTFGPTTKPIIFHGASDAPPLADQLR